MITSAELVKAGWLTGHFTYFHYHYIAYWAIPLAIFMQLFYYYHPVLL